jgi:putative flippase GtrA
MSAWLPHFLRLLRYGGIGIGVSLLYSGLVAAAVDVLGIRSATMASTVAFLLALPVSLVAHRMVSFRDANADPRSSYRFAVIAVVSFVCAVGGMKLMTDIWKLHYVFGILVAWALVPAANFIINTLWVFPLPRPASIKTEDENKPRHEAVP